MRSLFVLLGAALCAHAQWVTYPAPGIPRTPDGKPNLTAPAPRASDGKPDLSGVWQVEPSPWPEIKRIVGNMNDVFAPGDDLMEFSKYAFNVLADFKPEDAPIRPETVALMRERQHTQETKNTRESPCLPPSITFGNLIPAPAKWLQTPAVIAILQEAGFNFRQVYLDGRKPPSDPQPLWLGYSVGKWAGETLVVDTTGFNGKSSLDVFGHPYSEALHLTERYHRRDFGHLDVELTIDDPKMYTKPFTIKYTQLLVPDSDVLESICEENEKDVPHLAKQ